MYLTDFKLIHVSVKAKKVKSAFPKIQCAVCVLHIHAGKLCGLNK
jgi:hypothetical protein